jgi:hypothetical protein
MTWAVKFRGKDFFLDETFDPVFEYLIREELLDTTVVPGSVLILFHRNHTISNITFEESADADALPFTGIHGQHLKLGEVYIFYTHPDDDPQTIVLYDADDFGAAPFNEKRFPLNDE